MSKPFKTSKAELIAIYRLEFYKRKSNWKFSHDLRKEKSPPCIDKKGPKGNVLNKTYDIETVSDEENDFPPLNDAFLHSGAVEENLLDIPAEPDPPVLGSKPEPSVGHEWDNWVQKEEQNEGAAHQYRGRIGWPVESQVWINKDSAVDVNRYSDASVAACQSQSTSAPERVEEQCAQCPEWLVSSAEGWLRGEVAWLPEEQANEGALFDQSSVSVDSFAEFMRGAHRVPHSSECDLQPPPTAPGEDEAGGSLAELTTRQLAAAVERHARHLRRLLGEARARTPSAGPSATAHQWSRPWYSLDSRCYHTDGSIEELPTRDIGPYAPGDTAHLARERTFSLSTDCIVAGSLVSRVGGDGDQGRGRGRLRSREAPLIRIGMGRPYRL